MLESARSRHTEHKESSTLVFIGSPLLDITTECGPDLVQKYAILPDDCLRAQAKHDDLFRELFDDPCSRLDAGGSALNSAKIAKWALGKLGKVAFAGCVGNDEFAAIVESDLYHCGVEPLLITLPKHQTGVCACLLTPDGKRSMCTRHGASAAFKTDYLEERGIGKWLSTAQCIFVVGYFAAHSPDVVEALADRLLPNQLFALSLSAEYICTDYKETLLAVLPKVDVLFGNEKEILAFGKAAGMKYTIWSATEKAACTIAALMDEKLQPGIVLVTRGHRDVIFVRRNEKPRYFRVPRNVEVLDSVGAGDALAGAFLGVYALTGDADRAVLAGIKAAVEIVQVPGCQPPDKKLSV